MSTCIKVYTTTEVYNRGRREPIWKKSNVFMHKVILIGPWKRRGQYGTWSARWGRGKGHTQLRLWVQTQRGFMEQPKYSYDPISHGGKTGEKWVWQSRFEPGFERPHVQGQGDWARASWKWRANKRCLIKGIRWPQTFSIQNGTLATMWEMDKKYKYHGKQFWSQTNLGQI